MSCRPPQYVGVIVAHDASGNAKADLFTRPRRLTAQTDRSGSGRPDLMREERMTRARGRERYDRKTNPQPIGKLTSFWNATLIRLPIGF